MPALLAVVLAAGLSVSARAEPAGHTVVTGPATPEDTFGVAEQRLRVQVDGQGQGAEGDVPALLDGLGGVSVQRTNRGAATPILRGFVGVDNVLTLDGVRLNLATWRTGPNQYAALVDPLMLEAVEVRLGASGARHGSGGLGGAIEHEGHGFARDVGGPLGGVLRLEASSHDSGLVGYGRVHYGAGVVDGWAGLTVRHLGELRVGGGEVAPGTDLDILSWGTRNRVRLGPSWRLIAATYGSMTTGARRVDQLAQGSVRDADNLEQLAYLRLEHRALWQAEPPAGLRVESARVTASLRHALEEDRQLRCPRRADGAVQDREGCARDPAAIAERRDGWRDEVFAPALDGELELSALSRRLRAELMAGARGEWVQSTRPGQPASTPRFGPGSRYLSAYAGTWLDLALVRPSAHPWAVRVDGGLRAEATRVGVDALPGLGPLEADLGGVGGAARFLASYRDELALWGAWNRGFRIPNLQEATVLGDTGQTFEIPNPALGPQRADTLELGLRLRHHDGEMRFDLSGTVFDTRLRGAIIRVPAELDGQAFVDGKEVGQRINAEGARHQGFELMTSWRHLALGLWVDLGLAWFDGEVRRADGALETPRRLAPAQGRALVGWASGDGRWQLGTGLRWAGPQRALAPGDLTDLRICADPGAPHRLQATCAGTEGWLDLRLWARFRPLESLSLSLHVDNLLDRRYRTHGSGLDAGGFGVRLIAEVR